MSLMQLLAKPYPLIEGIGKKFTVAFAFGVFVFLFLFFFKPFGIGTFINQQIFLFSLGFGGVTFTIMFINFLILDKIFLSFFREENWTVGKEIFITLVHVAFIGLGNYILAVILSITSVTLERFLYFEFISLCVGVFPIVVWTLIKENRLLKENREEAEKFKNVLQTENISVISEPTINKPEETQPRHDTLPLVTFTSENENATVKTETGNVLFIVSADNYIKIHLSEKNTLAIKLLRSSLKRTEEDLKDHPQFYRCHRAYIVNLQKVESVTGNARGLKLTLENCLDEVPVSRSLNEEIREKLKQLLSR
jgi:LytTr DNA-binding domain